MLQIEGIQFFLRIAKAFLTSGMVSFKDGTIYDFAKHYEDDINGPNVLCT